MLPETVKEQLDKITFITVSNNDPLRDEIISYVNSKGSGVAVDMDDYTPHFKGMLNV